MSAKDINIKIPTYYFFNDIINIKDFDPNNIKKDEKSYKNILLYNIGSVKIKNQSLKTQMIMMKNSDDYMIFNRLKIKFDPDDNLPLNKTIEILIMTIVVRAFFHENNKYYPQVFLDECLYKT